MRRGMALFSGPAWFPVIPETPESRPWMLAVQHRKPPLEATITGVWCGNLNSSGAALIPTCEQCGVCHNCQPARAQLCQQADGLGSFLSHELRAPLAGILAAGEISAMASPQITLAMERSSKLKPVS